MIDREKIVSIVTDVATANLSHASVRAVTSEPTIDSEGHEALRIMIVLTPGSPKAIKGDKVLDTLVEIQSRLQRAGEERFPFVEFATEEELAQSGDS